VLTFVDLTGIQPFIFTSNRLRDAVGGSQLVAELFDEDRIDQDCDGSEHEAYSGGGNALVTFDGDDAVDAARRFAARLSRRIHDTAPGLGVAIVHVDAAAHPSVNQALAAGRNELAASAWLTLG
jgi:hypothetical protein